MKEKRLTAEVSVTGMEIFNNVFDKFKELLKDDRIDQGIREEYYQELLNLLEDYKPNNSFEEEKEKIDKLFK